MPKLVTSSLPSARLCGCTCRPKGDISMSFLNLSPSCFLGQGPLALSEPEAHCSDRLACSRAPPREPCILASQHFILGKHSCTWLFCGFRGFECRPLCWHSQRFPHGAPPQLLVFLGESYSVFFSRTHPSPLYSKYYYPSF